VLMAKNYIDNLSEETRKGMLEKAEQGIWPGAAPMGYSNVARADGKRVIDVDPVYAPLVSRLFETYANGNHSISDLSELAFTWGLRGRKNGKKVPVPTLHYTLTNPLYTGEFAWNGKVYQGIHKPLVTRELWDRVQAKLEDRCTYVRRDQKHEFPFSGLVRCGVCLDLGDQGERVLVGELQKGRLIYYHCEGCRKAKRATYIRQERIDEAMVKALKTLRLDEEVIDWVKRALLSSHGDEQRFHGEAIARFHKQYEQLQRRIEVAYDDRLDGKIPMELFERKSEEWRAEQKRILREIERHQNADESYMAEGIALMQLAGRAVRLYEAQEPSDRRKMLNFVLLNATWRDQNLEVTWRQPFDLLAETAEACRKNDNPPGADPGGHSKWLPLLDLNQRPSD
jgi:site-specific DNA recombinase